MAHACLKFVKKLMTSSFSNFHWIKLKFGLGGRFWDPASKCELKNWIKCPDLTKKGIIPFIWSTIISIDGHHGKFYPSTDD